MGWDDDTIYTGSGGPTSAKVGDLKFENWTGEEIYLRVRTSASGAIAPAHSALYIDYTKRTKLDPEFFAVGKMHDFGSSRVDDLDTSISGDSWDAPRRGAAVKVLGWWKTHGPIVNPIPAPKENVAYIVNPDVAPYYFHRDDVYIPGARDPRAPKNVLHLIKVKS